MHTLENEMIRQVPIRKASNDQIVGRDDQVAIEEPLEIEIQCGSQLQKVSVTMRTPGNDDELATGFLFTEGIITNAEQVAMVETVATNTTRVSLKNGEMPVLKSAERNFYTTSSCGVCGKASIDAIRTVSRFGQTPDEIRLEKEIFEKLEPMLRKSQQAFISTGGLHASALFDLNASLIDLREDVGRHNALDKLIGARFQLKKLPLDKHILLLSGRASFELIQKANMAGIKIVAAIGAPSSLAIEMAIENKMTLIGFLRAAQFNIYSGHQRIIGA